MFILDLPDLGSEKVCFVNPSGLIELWVTKSRFIRYKKPDRLLQYLRRKLGDKTIHKIVPYENDSYSIIRHPLQDFREFIKSCDEYVNGEYYKWYSDEDQDGKDRSIAGRRDYMVKCIKLFITTHIELFNSLDFVITFCDKCPSMYPLMPDRFKSNNELLKIMNQKSDKYKL